MKQLSAEEQALVTVKELGADAAARVAEVKRNLGDCDGDEPWPAESTPALEILVFALKQCAKEVVHFREQERILIDHDLRSESQLVKEAEAEAEKHKLELDLSIDREVEQS